MTDTDLFAPDMLRFDRVLPAPVERVWDYLVDPELRARWFMGGPTDARPGGRMVMTMEHDRLSDGMVPTPEPYRRHLGQSWEERILRCEPPHLLSFTWEGGAAGEVTIELSETDGGTHLRLTHTGLRGHEDAVNFGGGWHAHLAVLQRRLGGQAVESFWALHDRAEAAAQAALDG